jgi:DNA-binding NarL/FixJ family response regulator
MSTESTPPFPGSGSSHPWVSRVFVVDDHVFYAGALASLIGSAADLSICGVANRPEELVDVLPLANPDVLIMDVNMSAKDNWALVVAVRRWSTHVPILLSSSLQNPRLEQSLRWIEPCSFIEKGRDPSGILLAVREVMAKAKTLASQGGINSSLQKT